MNNIQILATITREPELKYTQGGVAILSFGIAYNEKRKQQDGSYGDIAHFFDVTAFGKRAETVNQWFNKGSRILIQGSLDYQSWEKDGQKRNKVGIKLSDFDFIDKRESNNAQTNQAPQQQQQSYQAPQPTYENKQGQQISQQQYQQQMPQQPPVIDIDDSQLPF